MKNKNKYNVAARAALFALILTAAFALNANAITLWYNGDADGVNGLANERNTVVSQAGVYDDFAVTGGPAWHVTNVFSDNLMTAGEVITSADWEIRTGISAGNAGTLVAGGTSTNLTVTLTGRIFFGLPEQMVVVNGLNLTLPALPAGQEYWLNVTPADNGTGRSFNSTTSGANCIGTCGNDPVHDAFFNSTFFGAFFTPTQVQGQDTNFSNGVIGTVVPEPATVALLVCGVGALLIAVRRRRSS